MDKKKLLDIFGIILLLIGFFFAFLPHAFHAKAGFEEESHLRHVVYGIALVIAALAVLVWNNKALKFPKSK